MIRQFLQIKQPCIQSLKMLFCLVMAELVNFCTTNYMNNFHCGPEYLETIKYKLLNIHERYSFQLLVKVFIICVMSLRIFRGGYYFGTVYCVKEHITFDPSKVHWLQGECSCHYFWNYFVSSSSAESYTFLRE